MNTIKDLINYATNNPNHSIAILLLTLKEANIFNKDKPINLSNINYLAVDSAVCGRGFNKIAFCLPKETTIDTDMLSRWYVRLNSCNKNDMFRIEYLIN